MFPGETLRLHVTTDAARYRVAFARWGRSIEPAASPSPWLAQEVAEIDVPHAWRPGVYVAMLETDPPASVLRADPTGATPDARSGRALFVVRPREPQAALLVVLPLFTYHAYNVADVDGRLGVDEGACLYSGAKWVSLQRPGGGTGGHPWDEVNADVYDPATPRQTFAHWDAKAIAWLERCGIAHDVCTDVELHDGSADLTQYRAMASFGHHEYWTPAMRERVERYVASAGNVAFFGGNTCWFRAVYDADAQAVRRDGRWTGDPEWKMTGVSYAFGGGKWIGARPPSGYRALLPRHWIFEGADLREGDAFGFPERLIGYECDGAPPESDLEVLAEASIAHWPVGDGSGELSETACATMGIREAGGLVFTASTVDWARVLAQGEPVVEAVTRNVLRGFLRDV